MELNSFPALLLVITIKYDYWDSFDDGSASGIVKHAIISMIFAIIIIKNPIKIIADTAPIKYTAPVVLKRPTFVYSEIEV